VIVVADTGPLYALADRDDAWHRRVAEWWGSEGHAVVVPVTVIPEVTYLLGSRIGAKAEDLFVRSLADGELTVEPLESEDIARAADLMRAYADLALGFTDASVIAIAERLMTRKILTTDRRHFGVVRPRHVKALTLLP
jgi:predicted nucleic acid-binding protein